MLQINTGKLFSRPVGRENQLRGVLYTNLVLGRDATETVVGRLIPSSELSKVPKTVIYEFTERIETEESGKGVLVSHGATPYLQDMAVVFSFVLNCVCTPDVDLTRRLTTGQRGLSTGVAPNRLIRRVFDQEIWCQPDDVIALISFVEQLIGLHRTTFLSVMRAIRTFVTGLHRVADDLELAYTLMVASVESLAQEFDGHESEWESVDERKRSAVDEALTGAPDNVAERVRAAILKVEHVALGRRFREFVCAHVNSSYFRSGFQKEDHPIGRSELHEVLGLAYQARSKYVHQLRQLPDPLSFGHAYNEGVVDGRSKMLTLQGLSRLMRHVIIEFVNRQPTIEKESYTYRPERAGVVQVRLAPQYWVGRSAGDISSAGRDKLEGLLEQLAGALLKEPNASITDMRDVLAKFAETAAGMKREHRIPYLAIYALFNAVAGANAFPSISTVDTLVESELELVTSESLVIHAFFCQVPPWSLEDHHEALRAYRRRRGHRNGIRFPRVFEAAIALELAERYRMAGSFEMCHDIVTEAAEEFPECDALRTLTQTSLQETPLRWRDVLLPCAEQTTTTSGKKGRMTAEKSKPTRRRYRALMPHTMRIRRR